VHGRLEACPTVFQPAVVHGRLEACPTILKRLLALLAKPLSVDFARDLPAACRHQRQGPVKPGMAGQGPPTGATDACGFGPARPGKGRQSAGKEPG
jgi:hypothetical protein